MNESRSLCRDIPKQTSLESRIKEDYQTNGNNKLRSLGTLWDDDRRNYKIITSDEK